MSPVIGSLANSSARGLGGLRAFGALTTSFESIATFTGGTSSIEFTSIPATYQHLQIRFTTKDTRSGAALNNVNLIINSDTGSNYTDHVLLGNGGGGSATFSGDTGLTYAAMGLSPSGTSTADVFSGGVIDIVDYANTNKYKTLRSFHGFDSNGSGSIRLRSSLWQNTNAITSIKLQVENNGNFNSNSRFALYGIKGV
jgi:hypothetical protein